MIIAAPDIPGMTINDLDAINAVLMHPGVYGEAAGLPTADGALVLCCDGVVVAFMRVAERVHECHQAVVPEKRGAEAIAIMRQIRDWWWKTQPSDLMLGCVRREYAGARHTMHVLGFKRHGVFRAACVDGIEREIIDFRMERPNG